MAECKTVYIVLPCFNEEAVICETMKQVREKLMGMIEKGFISDNSRMCFVNDGSSDNTWDIIRDNCLKDKYIVGINLAHNKGHQYALMAGLMSCRNSCDAIITMDADLQQDVDAIEEFISKYYEGYDIVYGVRKSRGSEGTFKKMTGNSYYRFMRSNGVEMVTNSADYRLMDRKALDALSKYKESRLFLRGLIPTIGMKWTTVEYAEKDRAAGESKYSLQKMMDLAMDGIVSMTIKPIHIILYSGMLVFLLSIIAFIICLCCGASVQYLCLISIWLFGGLMIFSIGVIGEYVGRNSIEIKHRPAYIISDFIMDCEEKVEEKNI